MLLCLNLLMLGYGSVMSFDLSLTFIQANVCMYQSSSEIASNGTVLYHSCKHSSIVT